MLFNSIDFAVFLPIVFILYWFFTNWNLKLQNILIVIVSYIFYGWWDWKFLTLICFSSIVDYSIGIGLQKYQNRNTKTLLLYTSISINLGCLFFFKYYNFFISNFTDAFSFFGFDINTYTLNIILPVGISFYTFQTLSYTIDVYKRKLEPTKDFISFLAFVSFFPQLVAGPIERATNLLPQFYTKRKFNFPLAIDGLRQIVWGLFKKIVIADACAPYVNDVFTHYHDYSGGTLIFGAILFSFQIYGDFSGYSDIAIGVSKLFGFKLMTNFRTPYFSRNIGEFWRRWHISLSTWFRDYIYIPLGGSKNSSKIKSIRNIFTIFIISGFWHGANWTYIAWGTLNAIYFIPSFLMKKNKKYTDSTSNGNVLPTINDSINITITYSLTVLAWVFFRSNTITDSINYIKKITTYSPNYLSIKTAQTYTTDIRPLAIYLIIFITIDWYYKDQEVVFSNHSKNIKSILLKYFLYLVTIISIIFSIENKASSFIYFQF